MMRKIGLFLIGSVLFSTNAFATTNHVFAPGLAIEYELPTNDPQVFSNVLFWTIKATCTIVSDSPESHISIKMIRKTGSVNDLPLNAEQPVELIVKQGDKLNITANSGAQVELINHSEQTIKASCATS